MAHGNYSIYPNGAGIYKLTCVHNGKIYIGKTVDFRGRFSKHKQCHKNSKDGYYLKNAIMKYGWESFKVDIIEIFEDFNKLTDNPSLLERESHYINLFDSTNPEKGYNFCKYSTDRTGVPHTPEAKEKMRQKALARTYTQEEKDRLRTINIGRKLSEEHKEKIRRGNLGKFVSDETRKKLSEASKGKPKSKEAVEKTRKANLGRVCSEETREKMRKSSRYNKERENV